MKDKPPICNTFGHLLGQICKAHRNKGNQLLACYNLHAGQEIFLQQALQQDGITLNELTDTMGVTPVTVTRMAERLEKNGFLVKGKCTEDQRLVRVCLTEKGKEAAARITEKTCDILEQQIVKNMSMEERILLKRLLQQVLRNLGDE